MSKNKIQKFNVGDYISQIVRGEKCISKVIEVDEVNKGYTIYEVEGMFANTPSRYWGLPFSKSNEYTLEENYKER